MVLGGGVELLLEVGSLVVQGDVKAKVVGQELALVVAAGNGDNAGTGDLGDLGSNATSGTSSTGDNNGLTGLDAAADVLHANPGGHTDHAETGEHVLGTADVGVVGGGLEHALTEDGVLGPAAEADNVVALGSLLAAGSEDAADTGAAHDGTDLDGGDVRARVYMREKRLVSKSVLFLELPNNLRTVQPAAHGGVKRQVENLNQNLAILELAGSGNGSGAGLEGLAGDDVVDRTLGEVEGGVLKSHGEDWINV